MEQKKTGTDWLYVAAMMVLASALCFFELTRNSLRLDEVTTFLISSHLPSLFHIIWIQEGNMWLYYFLLHFWLGVGNNEWILRSFSAFCAVLTVPVFYKLAQEVTNEKIAKIATPLFITHLYFIYLAQTARSYALTLLLITLASYFFFKFIKNPANNNNLFLYALFAVLAVYTHILVGLVIMVQYIAFLFMPHKIPWKKILITTGGIFVAFIPLLVSPSLHGPQLDWLQKPPLVHLPFGIVMLAGDSVFLTVLTGLLIVFLLWKKRDRFMQKTVEQFSLVWLLLWAGFPIIFSFLFSFIVKPIYQPQYFNMCLPAFILLVVLGLEECKQKKLVYKIILVTLFFFAFLRLGQWYTSRTHYLTEFLVVENKSPDDWRSAVSTIAQRGKPTDAVIYYAYFIREPFEYYYNTYDGIGLPKSIEISSGPYDLGGGTKIPEPNMAVLASLSLHYSRVWLVLSENDTSVLGRKTQWLEVERELSKNYVLTTSETFNKIIIKLWTEKM